MEYTREQLIDIVLNFKNGKRGNINRIVSDFVANYFPKDKINDWVLMNVFTPWNQKALYELENNIKDLFYGIGDWDYWRYSNIEKLTYSDIEKIIHYAKKRYQYLSKKFLMNLGVGEGGIKDIEKQYGIFNKMEEELGAQSGNLRYPRWDLAREVAKLSTTEKESNKYLVQDIMWIAKDIIISYLIYRVKSGDHLNRVMASDVVEYILLVLDNIIVSSKREDLIENYFNARKEFRTELNKYIEDEIGYYDKDKRWDLLAGNYFFQTKLNVFPGIYNQILSFARYRKLDLQKVKERLDNAKVNFYGARIKDRFKGLYSADTNVMSISLPGYFIQELLQQGKELNEQTIHEFLDKNKTYYATLAHEAVHALQQEKLLSRDLKRSDAEFGSLQYYKEDPYEEGAVAGETWVMKTAPQFQGNIRAYIDSLVNEQFRQLVFVKSGLTPEKIQNAISTGDVKSIRLEMSDLKNEAEKLYSTSKQEFDKHGVNVNVFKSFGMSTEILKETLKQIKKMLYIKYSVMQPSEWMQTAHITPERWDKTKVDFEKSVMRDVPVRQFGDIKNEMIKIANRLEKLKLYDEADFLDSLSKKLQELI